MTIYRIYPEKDTSIFTENVEANAGIDEILEIGSYPILGVQMTSRILTQFKSSEIEDTINNKIRSSNFSASLHLYFATAEELPINFNIEAYPLYDPWIEGFGKVDDSPIDKTGASWAYSDTPHLTTWTSSLSGSGYPTFVTGSFEPSYAGGGSWYTGSNSGSVSSIFEFSNDTKDIDIDVSKAIHLFYTGALENRGFILKMEESLEKDSLSRSRAKYYSKDTNTIYSPYLEFKWDDSFYSSSLPPITTDKLTLSSKNKSNIFYPTDKKRFRLSVKPKFPPRTFTTSSIYLKNYILPEESYWGIKDEYTGEMLINFDPLYTKISADEAGSFFDLYMKNLPQERYYRILVKTSIDNNDLILDDRIIFKVAADGN